MLLWVKFPGRKIRQSAWTAHGLIKSGRAVIAEESAEAYEAWKLHELGQTVTRTVIPASTDSAPEKQEKKSKRIGRKNDAST